MKTAKNRYIEPAEKIRLQKRFEALYVVELVNLKRAAELVGISTVTACKWVKEMALKEKKAAAMNKAKNGRDNDSANFLYVRLDKMGVPYFQQFVKDFNQIFNSY